MPRPKRIESLEPPEPTSPIVEIWEMKDAPPEYMRAGFRYVAHIENPNHWTYEPWFAAFAVAEQHGELFYFG